MHILKALTQHVLYVILINSASLSHTFYPVGVFSLTSIQAQFVLMHFIVLTLVPL